MSEALYDDELYEEVAHNVRAELAALVDWDEDVGDEPSDDELALIGQQITDMEEEAGVDLDDDEFQRVGELIQQYGDPETAFNLVVREGDEAVQAWDQEFERGVKALQEQIGRKLTPAEREKLIDHHDDVADPDPLEAWEELYGRRYSDEQIEEARQEYEREASERQWDFEHAEVEARERIEQELEAEREKTGTYSPDALQRRLQEWTEANRPVDADAFEAELRASGRGDFNLDDPDDAARYIDARNAPSREEVEEAVAHDLRPVEPDEDSAEAIARKLDPGGELGVERDNGLTREMVEQLIEGDTG